MTFRLSAAHKPMHYEYTDRIEELSKTKQHRPTPLFLHEEFRGLLHADYADALERVQKSKRNRQSETFPADVMGQTFSTNVSRAATRYVTSPRPSTVQRPMTSYFSAERKQEQPITSDDTESKQLARQLKQEIRSFEKAKKCATKNRYPNTNWAETPDFDLLVKDRCMSRRIGR
jgi:hypothetical protein